MACLCLTVRQQHCTQRRDCGIGAAEVSSRADARCGKATRRWHARTLKLGWVGCYVGQPEEPCNYISHRHHTSLTHPPTPSLPTRYHHPASSPLGHLRARCRGPVEVWQQRHFTRRILVTILPQAQCDNECILTVAYTRSRNVPQH